MRDGVIDGPVLIRGGGEMATGIAHRLYQCHFRVLITEVAAPTAVRRTVAFAEAVYDGRQTVEGVQAVRVATPEEAFRVWSEGGIPLFVDPEGAIRREIRPAVLVDAIMAKRNTGTAVSDAPLVIGVGPGFTAGGDVHAVVESNRGHHLGRVIWSGGAQPDTGVPAPVDGHGEKRVLRTPRAGRFTALREIGDPVRAGETVGEVDGAPIAAEISGMLRGLLRSGIRVPSGIKAGDVDPRHERGYCYLISDKARAIAGGVLEAILHAARSSQTSRPTGA
ncbi:MAG TPA: selenium-dependent molybdenum cofactor biosynthesis protein YqeB [candidate division Zixibacteria bacterium]|nr:selenium-dependent molybdenum cofactor biosynthesis protein YqeB [candidate division Zixibacteria bacterium]